jgi:gluconolactonase
MDIEVVAEGLEFPEGPIAMADGSVILVEIKRKTLTRVQPDGQKDVIAELGGGPNGAAIGPDGAVYVTNNGGFQWIEEQGYTVPHGTALDYQTGSIQRVDLQSGSVTTLYDQCDGRNLRGPNDLVFDKSGGFWFTDLGKNDGNRIDIGHLLYATPDGKSIRLVRDRMMTPNGVGLSPDEKTVYVAESYTSRVWCFDVVEPGVIHEELTISAPPKHVLGPLPSWQVLDSLAIEQGGKICVGTIRNGGITIFDPVNRDIEHIPMPDPSITNICFGGADMQTAWITASGTGKLLKCRWPRPGLKLNFNA